MRWLRSLWAWFAGFLSRRRPYEICCIPEQPDKLSERIIYLIGEGGHLWFAVMLCPCGCGETLHMSLLVDGRPRWELTEHFDGTISLVPSIWRKTGCRSHFWLRHGQIRWCKGEQSERFTAA